MGLVSQFWDLALTLSGFALLLVASWSVPTLRDSIKDRKWRDWCIDSSGMFIQGWLVPLAKTYGLVLLFKAVAPQLQGALALPSWAAFALAFVAVDYAYYWNHRLLHRQKLWPLHRLHHSAQSLDLFASARNTLVTPIFIVYLWAHSLSAYLLADPIPYVLGASLTAILDLWRHSPGLGPKSAWCKSLLWPLILPEDHATHHSTGGVDANYGANLKIWDLLHGTYKSSENQPRKPVRYGWAVRGNIWRNLLIPW